MTHEEVADYQTFRAAWIAEIEDGCLSSVEKGRRFATKLLNQWISLGEDDEMINCDGSGDGGIDIAILQKGESDEVSIAGDKWYLVQSKFGTAWSGEETALQEGHKVINTLCGKREGRLSSLAQGVSERLDSFRRKAGPEDRIILIFAKVDPPTDGERQVLEELRTLGRHHLATMFDVGVVSLRTIYDQLVHDRKAQEKERVTVDIKGSIVRNNEDLLVGVVSLFDMYEFLKSYRRKTQDLDQIYDHNVRRFLGGTVKINKGIRKTLLDAPERFGLYNNGITIVVSDFREKDGGHYSLISPYIVNGCQTTRTIWNVLHANLGSGGTGAGDDPWKEKIRSAGVVVKVAKVGEDTDTISQITRHTNLQNAVRERDFLALDDKFREWQRSLEEEHGLYLEIQRGAWDSRRALQKQKPEMKQLAKSAAASELMKVYGAGWLMLPGVAFGKSAPFLPDGEVFKKIMARESNPFGETDLYAAHLLQEVTQQAGFGRGARKNSRKQTKYLFAFVAIHLLRDTLQKVERDHGDFSVSSAVVAVLTDVAAREGLTHAAGQVIDDYFQDGADDSIYREEEFIRRANSDLNAFLKWEQLGKDLGKTPKLRDHIKFQKQFMGKEMGPNPSVRDVLVRAFGDAGR